MQDPLFQYDTKPKKQEEEDPQASQDAQPKTAEDVAKKGAVDALREAGLSPDEEKNDLRNRLERERQERVMKKELKDFARKQSDPASHARDTNPRRREESVTRTSSQLEAPNASVTQVSETGSSPSGEPIPFYVYQDGMIGTLSLLTQGSFTPI